MSIEDDIDDEMVGRIAAKLGLGGSGSGTHCRYEAIEGHRQWHVMRVQGERRESVRIVPTREDADSLIKILKKADQEGRA